MMGKPDDEIRQHYEDLGLRRYKEGIPLCEVIYAGILTKHHLLEYVHTRGLADTAVEIYAEQELSNKINQFFDNAIYCTAKGYEKAAPGSKAAEGRAPGARVDTA